MMDLDHFKKVNDTHGHQAGSHTLKEIGSLMGVSESRVCQLHSQAVGRIRARLSAEMLEA